MASSRLACWAPRLRPNSPSSEADRCARIPDDGGNGGGMPSSRQVVAALTVTTALLLVGACDRGNQGGSESITTPTGTGSEGSRRTRLSPPAKGEIDGFTWALPFEATSLDPIKSWAPPENTIC